MRELDRTRDSNEVRFIAATNVHVAAKRTYPLIGFIALFGACLSGYAGLGPWLIILTASTLAIASRGKYDALYERGKALHLSEALLTTALKSFGNGLAASLACYLAGLLLRII